MTAWGITNIVFAGVGGQGSVLAGQIVARAASLEGHRVVTSEVHGMAQRGGSVFTAVRYGPEVFSPVVAEGEADYLLAFERLEALRYLPYLRADGVALVNDQRIAPPVEGLRVAPYPNNVEELLRGWAQTAVLVPGLDVALRLGNPKLANTVLLGALSRFLDFEDECWHRALEERVPGRTLESNLAAFQAGADAAQEYALAAAGA
jgi:indolepyruvate ferredoxin oxidoreductase, beta subunit